MMIMMSSLTIFHRFQTTTFTLVIPLICFVFLLLLSPASPFRQLHPPRPSSSPLQEGLYFEEKTRLGSTPPSCHNKCNGCHPCMTVQVPTLPSHDPFQPSQNRAAVTDSMHFFEPSTSSNQYSNYKPLGWKCQCGDHFYNP